MLGVGTNRCLDELWAPFLAGDFESLLALVVSLLILLSVFWLCRSTLLSALGINSATLLVGVSNSLYPVVI